MEDKIKLIKDLDESGGTIIGKIIDIFQTTGPTVFCFDDGTKTLTAAKFVGPGKRAYPELKIGDIVKADIIFKEKNGELRADILNLYYLSDEEKKEYEKIIEKRKEDALKIKDFNFMIKSPILEKLKERYKKAGYLVKKAIMEGRPIIIRHHNDTDGYSAGIALERGISKLIIERYGEENLWKYLVRVVSRTPFYSVEDSIRDISFYQIWKAKFGDKKPLLIVADNGSTKEDEFSVRKVKIYGFEVIVIDHHAPNNSKIEELVDVHINPYVVGGDKNICAGMLCAEFAKMLSPDVVMDYIPALTGVADYCEGPEMDQYFEIAKKKYNVDIERLKKVAECIDFEAYYLGFIEGKGIIDDLLLSDIERHNKLIDLLYEELKEKQELALKIVKEGIVDEQIGEYKVIFIDFAKHYYPKEYPPVGKIMSLISFELEDNGINKYVMFGYVKDLGVGVIRAKGFNLLEFVDNVSKELVSVSGGGHEVAGSIRFAPRDFEKLIEKLKEEIKLKSMASS